MKSESHAGEAAAGRVLCLFFTLPAARCAQIFRVRTAEPTLSQKVMRNSLSRFDLA